MVNSKEKKVKKIIGENKRCNINCIISDNNSYNNYGRNKDSNYDG